MEYLFPESESEAMTKLSFHALEAKYGEPSAYHWLAQIEKAAGIVSDKVAYIDPEVRLAHAIWMQDSMAHTARQAA